MKIRPAYWGIAAAVAVLAIVAAEIVSTGPTRGAMRTYAALLAAANRPEPDLSTIRSLCTERYVAAHPITATGEGGVVGLPRNFHKNFQIWRAGGEVLLCPTNREGPVYRFLRERGDWRFDGLVGQLQGGKLLRGEGVDGGG